MSFSGGRDSSAVLAVAVHVARREGLGLPVPLTLDFPDDARSREDEWQEKVVRHLGVTDWQKVDPDGGAGLLSPAARRSLHGAGLLWPHNAYLHLPLADEIPGGTLLTGLEGDGLFGGWRWSHANDVLARRRRPTPRDATRLALAAAPASVRRLWLRRSAGTTALTWLRPTAHAAFTRRLVEERSREPARWDQRVHWWARRRYHRIAAASLEAVGRITGTRIAHPFLDPRFLAALSREGGRWGYGDRTEVMRALVGDLLPDAVLARRSKANFTATVWDAPVREFARAWDGTGVDTTLVDPDELRRVWLLDRPIAPSGTLLHAAWLHQQGTS